MTVTTLDPNVALIIIDLQKGLVGSPFIHPIDKVVERTRALLDAMTDSRPEAHDYSTRSVFPRLGETGTAHDIIALLAARRS